MVTRTRFQTPSETYAINGVTSVKTFEEKPNKWPAIACIAGGALIALSSLGADGFGAKLGGFVVGAVLAVGGYFWFKALKSTWHVLIRTASGEGKALSLKDGPFIQRVVQAINKALVARG